VPLHVAVAFVGGMQGAHAVPHDKTEVFESQLDPHL
jgi:hypothetical protein